MGWAMNDTDRAIAQIRAALDAGPEPGPWHVDHDRRPGMEWNRHIYHGDDLAICFMAHSGGEDPRRDEATAAYIAACHPENLRALLARLDERDAEVESANKRAEYWKAEHLAGNAEVERLRSALHDCDAVAMARGDRCGLCDRIDNSGSPYQSQWLADLMAARGKE